MINPSNYFPHISGWYWCCQITHVQSADRRSLGECVPQQGAHWSFRLASFALIIIRGEPRFALLNPGWWQRAIFSFGLFLRPFAEVIRDSDLGGRVNPRWSSLRIRAPQISLIKETTGMDRNVAGDSGGMSKATRLQKKKTKPKPTDEVICPSWAKPELKRGHNSCQTTNPKRSPRSLLLLQRVKYELAGGQLCLCMCVHLCKCILTCVLSFCL